MVRTLILFPVILTLAAAQSAPEAAHSSLPVRDVTRAPSLDELDMFSGTSYKFSIRFAPAFVGLPETPAP
jgi:hypothetical protein